MGNPNQYAVVGFGGNTGARVISVRGHSLYGYNDVSSALATLETTGSKEDGYYAILYALGKLPLAISNDYIVSVLLITDEPRTVIDEGRLVTKDTIIQAFAQQRVVFSSLLNVGLTAGLYDAVGVDYTGSSYLAAQNGGFLKIDSAPKVQAVKNSQHFCALFRDYGVLALSFRGSVWDIAYLTNSDRQLATSLRRAIVSALADSILDFGVSRCERCLCRDDIQGNRNSVCQVPRDQEWCTCMVDNNPVSNG